MRQAVKRPSVTPKPVKKPSMEQMEHKMSGKDKETKKDMMSEMGKKSMMKKSDMKPMKAKKSIGYKKGA